jgi:hypothetical protein
LTFCPAGTRKSFELIFILMPLLIALALADAPRTKLNPPAFILEDDYYK